MKKNKKYSPEEFEAAIRFTLREVWKRCRSDVRQVEAGSKTLTEALFQNRMDDRPLTLEDE